MVRSPGFAGRNDCVSGRCFRNLMRVFAELACKTNPFVNLTKRRLLAPFCGWLSWLSLWFSAWEGISSPSDVTGRLRLEFYLFTIIVGSDRPASPIWRNRAMPFGSNGTLYPCESLWRKLFGITSLDSKECNPRKRFLDWISGLISFLKQFLKVKDRKSVV